MNDIELVELQHVLCNIAHRAGQAILSIYTSSDEVAVTAKADHSPLTQADTLAHALIKTGLAEITPDIPVLSEESRPADITQRHNWRQYWLVDPLDGTKEFLRRNGEFTVNIALIEDGHPILSVVEAPAWNEAFSARRNSTAFSYQPVFSGSSLQFGTRCELHSACWQPGQLLRILTSRSHGRGAGAEWLEKLPRHQLSPLGSSLKLCRIASGDADLYLRLGPTSEWDTAAGQLILECAGGEVVDMSDDGPGKALGYNQRKTLLNPWFMACAAGVKALFETL